MYRLRTYAVALVVASLLLLSSCSLDAVAKFASQSSQALAQGPAILKDVEASCIRGQQVIADKTRQEETAKECAVLTSDTPAMLVASNALTAYFTAISQLASAGTTSADKNSKTPTQTDAQSAAKTPESVTLMKSAGTVIGVIGKLASAGYRAEHLQKDLNAKDVPAAVDDLLARLAKIGDVEYTRVLTIEQAEYRRQFENLGKLPANDSTGIIRVLAEDNESKEARLIATKKDAAKAYGEAIQTIIDGHKALLAHKFDAKDLPGLIQPYTDSLSQIVQQLIPLF